VWHEIGQGHNVRKRAVAQQDFANEHSCEREDLLHRTKIEFKEPTSGNPGEAVKEEDNEFTFLLSTAPRASGNWTARCISSAKTEPAYWFGQPSCDTRPRRECNVGENQLDVRVAKGKWNPVVVQQMFMEVLLRGDPHL
jgi:hypothetical protein